MNKTEQPVELILPDYVFSRLITAFQKIKPKEGMGVLYGKYITDEGQRKVKAEKIWVPPSRYLKSTSTGVALTEMGKKYHSSIDHFEIMSESVPIAWVHSHPISEPSEIDKTTQRIAQSFNVPLGVFLNYNKLDTPQKALTAFRMGRGNEVEKVPITILPTKALAPPHPVEIEIPNLEQFEEKSFDMVTTFGEFLSSKIDAFRKIAETIAEGDKKILQEIYRSEGELREQIDQVRQDLTSHQTETERVLKTTKEQTFKTFQDISNQLNVLNSDLQKEMRQQQVTTQDGFSQITEELSEVRKERKVQVSELEDLILKKLNDVAAEERQKIEQIIQEGKKELRTTQRHLLESTTSEINDLKNMLRGHIKELKRDQQSITQLLETFKDALEDTQRKTEENHTDLLEKIEAMKEKQIKNFQTLESSTVKAMKRIELKEERIEQLSQKIEDEVKAPLEVRFDELERQWKKLLKKLEEEDATLTTVQDQIKQLHESIQEFRGDIKNIQTQLGENTQTLPPPKGES